jgi:hypothetical protein
MDGALSTRSCPGKTYAGAMFPRDTPANNTTKHQAMNAVEKTNLATIFPELARQ